MATSGQSNGKSKETLSKREQDLKAFLAQFFFYALFFVSLLMIASFGLIAEA